MAGSFSGALPLASALEIMVMPKCGAPKSDIRIVLDPHELKTNINRGAFLI